MAAVIGSNLPPVDADPLRDRLQEENAPLLKRRDELLAAIERAPETVDDDETAGRMGDFSQKQIAACLKALEGARVASKEPFLSAGRTVDGFYQGAAKPLEDGKKIIDARRKAYLDKKAEEERARRREEERVAREAADKAQREAERLAEKARTEKQLEKALAAEDAAKRAAIAAYAASEAAAAKPAELSRVRGDFGSVSSLKQFWDFKNLNRAAVDLESLREHIPLDCIEKALRSWIRANGDALKQGKRMSGVTFFENTRL